MYMACRIDRLLNEKEFKKNRSLDRGNKPQSGSRKLKEMFGK